MVVLGTYIYPQNNLLCLYYTRHCLPGSSLRVRSYSLAARGDSVCGFLHVSVLAFVVNQRSVELKVLCLLINHAHLDWVTK